MSNLRVFLCWVAVFLTMACSTGTFAASFDEAAEEELLRLANQERDRKGLPPLVFNAQLRQAAREHAKLMSDNKVLTHDLPGEPRLQERLAATGLRSDSDAENVGFNETAAKAHEALMNSPGHRANILSPKYNAAGIGVVSRGETLWVVEDFAHVFSEYSSTGAEKIVADQVAEVRSRSGLPRLERRTVSELRKLACSMGQADKVEARSALSSGQARKAVTFTSTNPQKLPAPAEAAVRTADAKAFGVGACFARSGKYPAGVYWIVLVVY